MYAAQTTINLTDNRYIPSNPYEMSEIIIPVRKQLGDSCLEERDYGNVIILVTAKQVQIQKRP